ncbi:uncharacterized protein PHALS_06517 [Plasmopara halstedii]|uniref:Uncharacterized protein n=1 Tax=Plasmopara halstedii TaxID=4781 RepID=A0A0P1B3Z4_PLAHL|nr:uncharacterized protein PHALS_06517 [Plasmopara halstedii]CEG48704.1 hypothetical protein PHALS_06517 [Plasmopara halstedii]|eukprot:XP_024585073.1 hypothetical protein PHALS_06517 [Plasmopara halstedii]
MVVQQRGGSNNSSDNGGTDSENVPVRRQEDLGGASVTPIIDGRENPLVSKPWGIALNGLLPTTKKPTVST